MPDIHFDCPKCKQTLDAPEELATQLIECPTCKETIEVPVHSQRKEAPKLPEPPKPAPIRPPPTPTQVPEIRLPRVETFSGIASALEVIAVLEFIAAPIAGLGVGSDNTFAGWVIFLSGVISGLIFFGFAAIIRHLHQSAQRLHRIEILIQNSHDDKKAA